MSASDSVLRSITHDGSFRMITARTDATVRAASATQGVTGATARLFGELLTGAILFRETMAPQLRVQCMLEATGTHGGRVVADAHPDGGTRGFVNLPTGASDLDLGAGYLLRMSRALPGGRLHEGVVAVPANGGISAALMAYFQESEQVVSMIAVATTEFEGGTRSGGFLVQILPEVTRFPLQLMTERLGTLPSLVELLASDATNHQLTSAVFADLPHEILEENPVRFECRCSRDRASGALATAGRIEVEEAIRDDRELATTCDYCHTTYRFSLDDLARMLAGAQTAADIVH